MVGFLRDVIAILLGLLDGVATLVTGHPALLSRQLL